MNDKSKYFESIGVKVEKSSNNVKPYNKDVLQSYILTTARYDFNVYEKRILYKLIEIAQSEVQNLKFPQDCRKVQHDLFGFVEITLPISSILANEEDNNHAKVKKSLISLSQKFLIYEDNEIWEKINIVVFPKIKKFDSHISFTIHPKIWDCILDFSKGFRKFELKTTMQFESVYAMRFYELLSGQVRPLTFEIETLKEMFFLTNKYKENKDFKKYVIEPAKRELDKHSPYSFEFKINKIGRKFHSITFYPIKIDTNRDQRIEKHDLEKQLSARWILEPQTLKYLKDEYKFQPREINQWYELFKTAQKELDLLNFLANKKRYAIGAKNPKGYIISALKNEISRITGNSTSNEEQIEVTFNDSESKNHSDLTKEEAREIVNKIFKHLNK